MSLLSEGLLFEVAEEADRAHRKHGESSMYYPGTSHERRLAILAEEAGEVARELNEAAASGHLDLGRLRAEAIQVAAVALTWAQAIGDHLEPGLPSLAGAG